MPSIQMVHCGYIHSIKSFKPYYNWNAFNTRYGSKKDLFIKVLNLIITGMPSILFCFVLLGLSLLVLNLIITGMPSIHRNWKIM